MPSRVALGLLGCLLLLTGPARAQHVDRPGSERRAAQVSGDARIPEIRPDDRSANDQGHGSEPAGSPVPEPMQLAVFGSGLLALAILLSRRRQIRGSQS